jgi:hypothetical protein
MVVNPPCPIRMDCMAMARATAGKAKGPSIIPASPMNVKCTVVNPMGICIREEMNTTAATRLTWDMTRISIFRRVVNMTRAKKPHNRLN